VPRVNSKARYHPYKRTVLAARNGRLHRHAASKCHRRLGCCIPSPMVTVHYRSGARIGAFGTIAVGYPYLVNPGHAAKALAWPERRQRPFRERVERGGLRGRGLTSEKSLVEGDGLNEVDCRRVQRDELRVVVTVQAYARDCLPTSKHNWPKCWQNTDICARACVCMYVCMRACVGVYGCMCVRKGDVRGCVGYNRSTRKRGYAGTERINQIKSRASYSHQSPISGLPYKLPNNATLVSLVRPAWRTPTCHISQWI